MNNFQIRASFPLLSSALPFCLSFLCLPPFFGEGGGRTPSLDPPSTDRQRFDRQFIKKPMSIRSKNCHLNRYRWGSIDGQVRKASMGWIDMNPSKNEIVNRSTSIQSTKFALSHVVKRFTRLSIDSIPSHVFRRCLTSFAAFDRMKIAFSNSEVLVFRTNCRVDSRSLISSLEVQNIPYPALVGRGLTIYTLKRGVHSRKRSRYRQYAHRNNVRQCSVGSMSTMLKALYDAHRRAVYCVYENSNILASAFRIAFLFAENFKIVLIITGTYILVQLR